MARSLDLFDMLPYALKKVTTRGKGLYDCAISECTNCKIHTFFLSSNHAVKLSTIKTAWERTD